jgi:hypothetical protein
MIKRFGINNCTPVIESVEFRNADQGQFVNRLVHRQTSLAGQPVMLDSGLTISASEHARMQWQQVQTIRAWCESDRTGKTPFLDSESQRYYERTWSEGGRLPAIAQMSMTTYINLVLTEGPEVVFVSASNSLAHMGQETRTQAATMHQIRGAEAGQLEMINPDYYAAPLADDTILIDESAYNLIKALDDEGTDKARQHRSTLVDAITKENQYV